MRADLDALLLRLLAAEGPSGYEMAAAAVWREHARTFADVRSDGVGTSFATVNAGGSPRVALLGHLDEIGLVVSDVDPDTGVLWFGPIGHWDPAVLVGQRVSVTTREGSVPGVVGRRAWHLLDDDELRTLAPIDQLWIDIGAHDAAEAEQLVRRGDPIVLRGEPLRLAGGRLASRALDNRAGAAAVLEGARLAAAAGDLAAEIVVVGTVQEEISRSGSIVATTAVEPDLALAVDVTHVSDYPFAEKAARKGGVRRLGSGPAILRGASTSPLIAERLIALAEEHGVAYTLEAEGTATLTDADGVIEGFRGVACGLLCIPLRYMHSPSETVQLSDVSATAELIARFCRSLRPDEDWSR
jgi:endoglucanase